ncbi:hypothetical protein GPECTOR_5g323 [Gonium pectorale]|uniref:Pinin/SDK/MemA protein domain-containing protein n=1 Tax=Gonium pectorale TaxID=33097 RepID=A0A150GX19_GONPE|nr:hypothetical protein GPECTOR_5g323 [Gonium pectorale]|eukprot:KXZ54232.1 hypothetical protein GPECTOR_5g323 [Gonium pectorale]
MRSFSETNPFPAAALQASDAAARRAELARKAEEKAAAESERLRRAAAEERARKRQEELEALMDLNLATDIKVLELLYAKKLARRRALGCFLRADGVPALSGGKPSTGRPAAPVYWLPVKHNEGTLAVKERQQRELKDWEEAVMAELELEKDGLRQRAQARRDGIAERRQRAAEARAAGRLVGGGAAEEQEAAEDHEALEAVEFDAHHEDHGLDAEVDAALQEAVEAEAGERQNGPAGEAASGDAMEPADEAQPGDGMKDG